MLQMPFLFTQPRRLQKLLVGMMRYFRASDISDIGENLLQERTSPRALILTEPGWLPRGLSALEVNFLEVERGPWARGWGQFPRGFGARDHGFVAFLAQIAQTTLSYANYSPGSPRMFCGDDFAIFISFKRFPRFLCELDKKVTCWCRTR